MDRVMYPLFIEGSIVPTLILVPTCYFSNRSCTVLLMSRLPFWSIASILAN